MKLPVISGKELVRALEKAGFKAEGQKGSHVKMKKRLKRRIIVTIIPMHKELDTGTLIGILHQAEVTREEFMRLV
ncbi:type II toxin-antitoxin system HicA family toxin, partial [archaeon]|nr:type II toxin-antitoxin system HicA family toxin [archaeon]